MGAQLHSFIYMVHRASEIEHKIFIITSSQKNLLSPTVSARRKKVKYILYWQKAVSARQQTSN